VARVQVQSDIAGTVWKIEKQAGDRVAADDVIVILEAMKMEIPVQAPTSGTLAELLVDEGDAVEEEGTVAVIET
jgi:acetyl-CoA carboxylase biotin carboxyl carrier protein